jgi:hypothetical protein
VRDCAKTIKHTYESSTYTDGVDGTTVLVDGGGDKLGAKSIRRFQGRQSTDGLELLHDDQIEIITRRVYEMSGCERHEWQIVVARSNTEGHAPGANSLTPAG